MSHRIIEKRRRDRMNNCLADLSRLIPAEYLKKGRGRVEKTEIIEMAIKHMKHLQAHACNHMGPDSSDPGAQDSQAQGQMGAAASAVEHYRLGYQECLSETMHFLVEVEGYFAGDSICVQLINHLQEHCEKIVKGDRLNFSRHLRSETSSSSSRGYSGYSGGPSSTSSGSDSGGNGHSSSSKENVACNSEWRRQVEESPSLIPVSMTPNQSLPPPPPPQSACSEQADSPSPNSDAGSDAAASNTSSQLREMLTSAACTPPSGLQRRSSENSAADASGLYKFKNNIKQRFTAEHHHDAESKRRRLMVSGDGSEAAAPASVVVKLRDSVDSPPPTATNLTIVKRRSPSPTPVATPTPSLSSSPPTFGVPVFALHSKGSFYIPLTIDSDMLAPYMKAFSEHGQVLHPVTISVNFCGLATGVGVPAPQQQAAPMVPWRGEHPGFVPKWSVCDRA
ncbi:transcription factor cwo isoform X2 [Neocloeon triangulifer]|nr:transcription factor cwo isoform X2 [Neocloeon triangulifer]